MLQKLIRPFVKEQKEESSYQIASGIVKRITADPSFPRLISFPRTGSHWLRMMMELYFEKPSLVRTFYFHNAKEFICYHRHDEDLSIQDARNVLYLYRNPTDTVFSQMNYYREDTNDKVRIQHWANLYGMHLNKWLLEESFTEKKIIIKYENLRQDVNSEFKKICDHFSEQFSEVKLEKVLEKVSKESLKKKTQHDQQVVNLSEHYEEARQLFRNENKDLVREQVLLVNPLLSKLI